MNGSGPRRKVPGLWTDGGQAAGAREGDPYPLTLHAGGALPGLLSLCRALQPLALALCTRLRINALLDKIALPGRIPRGRTRRPL